jgi:S1-C subfamily serine protease
LITSVDMSSSADTAGLQCGDVIVDFAGAAVMSADHLMARVSATPPGTRVRAIGHREMGERAR